jgi:hypothetical protein
VTAAIQTQAWSVTRARKICVVILHPPFFGHHARIDLGAEIRKQLETSLLDFPEFPTTLSQRFQRGRISAGVRMCGASMF